MLSKDLRMAKRTDALLLESAALQERMVVVVICAHDGHAVALRLVQRENSGTVGRAIVCRKEAAPVACDAAPSLSQTPTRRAVTSRVE